MKHFKILEETNVQIRINETLMYTYAIFSHKKLKTKGWLW